MKINIIEIKQLSGGGFTVRYTKDGEIDSIDFGLGVSKNTSDLHLVVMNAIMELIRPANGP